MRRVRLIAVFTAVAMALLVAAPAAFASAGQGWYGETNDKTITNAMFLTIIFFPALITVLSLIQWRLDKRKHAKLEARKRRAASADWRGGW
jgi:ABC-type spermidine/putrescine transport system permease subunit II